MNKASIKRAMRRRHAIRLKSDRLRLSVYRSHIHIYAQIIDDSLGVTLASASTTDKQYKTLGLKVTGKEAAYKVGELLAARALEAGIKEVVYDKGAYAYHGRVAQLADGARAGGLSF